MKATKTLASVLAVLALSVSASSETPLRVVCTTTDLAAITRAVGGDRVAVTALATSEQDPHFLDARPSFMVKLRDADLFIKIGMELEIGYEKPLVDGARNPRLAPGSLGVLDASTFARKLEVSPTARSRAEGDVHPSGNPHIWLDPGNVVRIAAGIAERLTRLAPAEGGGFQARLAAFERSIGVAMFGQKAVDAFGSTMLWEASDAGTLASLARERGVELGGWWAKLAAARGRRVFTHHRTFIYLFDRFGIVQAGELEPKPGLPPSPRHLADLITRGPNERIGAVVIESFRSDKAARLVAEKIGATLVVLTPSAPADGSIVAYFDGLVDALAEALSPPTPGSGK